MTKNPYLYKYNGPLDPVKDKNFLVPRSDLLNKIIKGIEKGDYWTILGPSEIGKTTFLRQIENKLKNIYLILNFNLEVAPKSEEDFYQWLIDEFIDKIPSEREKIKKEGSSDPRREFLNFLEKFKPRENKDIILLFDEIEEIPAIKDFFHIWRTVYNERYQKEALNRYSIIITGTAELISLTAGPKSSFNIAEMLYMKDFSDTESEQLIDILFSKKKLKMNPGAKGKLIDQTSGHPQILQQACYNLVDIAVKEKREIVENDVDEVIIGLFKTNTVINTLAQEVKKNEKLKQLVQDILEGLKIKYHPYKEFSISGAGCIVEDKDNFCAIRNKIYERFLLDLLEIPIAVLSPTEQITISEEVLGKIENDASRRYKLVRRIGGGGMGEVFEAEDLVLKRHVAIKRLNRKLIRNQKDIENFHIEARASASLSHPNIVTIYDFGPIDDNYFISMEFINGLNFAKIINSGEPYTFPQVVYSAQKILEALNYSHQKNMFHCDIKPQNIMLTTEGKIKLLDFGLSAIRERYKDSDIEIILGTPEYMAPEQIKSDGVVDHRTDIYSLGVTIFFMVTGQRPFDGQNTKEIFKKHLEAKVPSIKELKPETPTSLAAIIEKCMEKKPEDRYQSAQEVLGALNKLKGITIKKALIENELKDKLKKISPSTGNTTKKYVEKRKNKKRR